ncbi:hypothetical protein XA68_10922 [Ophiocordyceps unilateralis]|uniref:C2H2-type domain-containing protein n=1 Tax=Ophiocordyceps unilateralis TaxID=268505 RepID=A0A2A9PHT9_OPHUN|nr:hypothetical protein XA68_10922 [Ophiocordyceps unilateralis]
MPSLAKPSYRNFQAINNSASQPRATVHRPSVGPDQRPLGPSPQSADVCPRCRLRAPRRRLPPPPRRPNAADKGRRQARDGAAAMSVAYETRSFIHEGAYSAIGDDSDHQRYTDSDVAEHLGHYTAEASILPDDDHEVLGHDRGIISDDDDAAASVVVQDATRLDLGSPAFPSPIIVPLSGPSMGDEALGSKDPSPGIGSPSSAARNKAITKPGRDVAKQSDGKFHCIQPDCKDEVRAFSRRCEWNKHMDKHERPYRCPAEGCENLPGFTYSGGLLRHEREVHGKHGGPRNTVNCPHPNCKRHTGKGFSRQENLNEHLRRVHTHMEGSTPPAAESAASPEDNESEKSGVKRKRRMSDDGTPTTTNTNTTSANITNVMAATTPVMSVNPIAAPGPAPDELSELRDEINRVRGENAKLKADMERQTQHSLAMMAQIAELQDALRHGLSQHGLGAPTASML